MKKLLIFIVINYRTVNEAAKCISVYKLTSMRNPVKRYTRTYEANTRTVESLKTVPSRDLLVYLTQLLEEQEKIDSSPRQYTVNLNILKELNPDYGNPSEHEGSLFNKINSSHSFLGKAADYF